MTRYFWNFPPMAVAVAFAVALAVPAHAARQASGPPVVVTKTNKALVASP
jgi:hypothetical protein